MTARTTVVTLGIASAIRPLAPSSIAFTVTDSTEKSRATVHATPPPRRTTAAPVGSTLSYPRATPVRSIA